MIDSYLNNGDLLPVNNRNSFITSLLEDEKEINEFLRNNELKRASTFYASSKNKFHLNHHLNKKENKNQNQNKSDNEFDSDEEIDSVEKLLKLRLKRGKNECKQSKLIMNKMRKPVKKYSLGMKQRLGIAAAVMERPDIVILDEPTNALDSDGVEVVKEILREEKKRGALVIISCHDFETLKSLSDRMYLIEAGRLKEYSEAAACRSGAASSEGGDTGEV
jgi:ATPase subunit of ABC transporter with duplicated ATPase domains